MSTEHASLVELASNGESLAIEELLERHLPRLRAFIRLRCTKALRDHESCSDLAQSVCREVLAKIERFEYRGEAAFCGWLFTKALSKIQGRARYYGAQKRDPLRPVQSFDEREGTAPYASFYAAVATPSRIAMGREELRRVEAAFDELPDDYREVLTLSRIAGLDYHEIAAATGRTEGSVRGLLQRALTRLSWIMGRQAFEER